MKLHLPLQTSVLLLVKINGKSDFTLRKKTELKMMTYILFQVELRSSIKNINKNTLWVQITFWEDSKISLIQ